jgi:hypothetical protein
MNKYQAGQILSFHKAVKGVAKNEALEVVSSDKRGITTRKTNGETLTITSRQVKAFGVFEKQDLEISAGDKLLLQANWREKSFTATNGELVTVASVAPGTIKLEDGRQLPTGYRQFTHGYAVTANYSQAKTVDYVVVLNDGMASDKAYVSYTRGREGLTIITSDVMALQESMGVSGDRQSATELARRAAQSSPAQRFADDNSYQLWEAHQEIQKAPAHREQVIQQEITNDVKRSPTTDYGISI